MYATFELTVYFKFSSVRPFGTLEMTVSAKFCCQFMSSSFSRYHVVSNFPFGRILKNEVSILISIGVQKILDMNWDQDFAESVISNFPNGCPLENLK